MTYILRKVQRDDVWQKQFMTAEQLTPLKKGMRMYVSTREHNKNQANSQTETRQATVCHQKSVN